MAKNCSGCKSHIQYLTAEAWSAVMDFKSKWDKEHPNESKLTKTRAVNLMILKLEELTK